jgi:transcription termination factor NusB
VAAKVLEQVAVHSRYLDTALAQSLATLPDKQKSDAALIQEMAYGVLRWFHQLDAIASVFIVKPLKEKDRDIQLLLLVGLYQLRHMRVARHAAVTETVEAATALKKIWAKNFLNACLRSYLREEARSGGRRRQSLGPLQPSGLAHRGNPPRLAGQLGGHTVRQQRAPADDAAGQPAPADSRSISRAPRASRHRGQGYAVD